MQRLPEDIVADILSRLPVKILVGIRYECKSWHSIISNPQFSKLQLERSNKNKNADNRKLLILSQHSPQLSLLDFEEYDDCDTDDVCKVSKLDYPLEHDEFTFALGSCNGLFCLEVGGEIVIWNPSIRQHKTVPNANSLRRLNFDVVYGFGYDSLSDDYKVVRVCRVRKNIIVDVFNLKTDAWRSIDYPDYGRKYYKFFSRRMDNLLNGSLHWLAQGYDQSDIKLVAFSLAEEKFLEVPKPDVDDSNKFWAVCVFDGCLCMSRIDRVDSGVELWVMKEYMVRASWTKLCTVFWRSIPKFDDHDVFLPIIWSSRDGNIYLGIDRRGVVKYSMREKRCTNTTLFELEEDDSLEAVAHVESLVSPNFNFNKTCETNRFDKILKKRRMA